MTTDTATVRRKLVTGGDPNQEYFVPVQEQFAGGYAGAVDLDGIASALVATKRPELAAHMKFDVVYLWKEKGGSRDGQLTLGKCVLVRGLLAHFVPAQFVVWLAADHLRDLKASAWFVEAILFHEMTHVGEEDGNPIAVPHDFTGFASELRHYGAYKDDLLLAAKACEQLPLFEELELPAGVRILNVDLRKAPPDDG
jgi:hypothetical protein